MKKGTQQRDNPVNITFGFFLALFSNFYCFSLSASLLWSGVTCRQQWLDKEWCRYKGSAGPLCALDITCLQKGQWELVCGCLWPLDLSGAPQPKILPLILRNCRYSYRTSSSSGAVLAAPGCLRYCSCIKHDSSSWEFTKRILFSALFIILLGKSPGRQSFLQAILVWFP